MVSFVGLRIMCLCILLIVPTSVLSRHYCSSYRCCHNGSQANRYQYWHGRLPESDAISPQRVPGAGNVRLYYRERQDHKQRENCRVNKEFNEKPDKEPFPLAELFYCGQMSSPFSRCAYCTVCVEIPAWSRQLVHGLLLICS